MNDIQLKIKDYVQNSQELFELNKNIRNDLNKKVQKVAKIVAFANGHNTDNAYFAWDIDCNGEFDGNEYDGIITCYWDFGKKSIDFPVKLLFNDESLLEYKAARLKTKYA